MPVRLKKPKAILFDITGTVAKTSFIDKVLLPYIQSHCRTYFEENWGTPGVKVDLQAMSDEGEIDPQVPKVPKLDTTTTTTNKDEIIDCAVKFVNYCTQEKKQNKALTLLRFHMWFDGYARKRLETPVYSDVAIQIQKWRCDQEIKLFVFSNGWAEATKRFLSKTNHGDLNLLIDGYFDTTTGSLTDPETFVKVLNKIQEQPENVTFLTKCSEEARAGASAGLSVVLVLTHRRNIERLDSAGKKLPRVRSFNEIEFE